MTPNLTTSRELIIQISTTSEKSPLITSKKDCYLEIIESPNDAELGSGFCYRPWNYAYISMKLVPKYESTDTCLDTRCGVSLVDKAWLLSLLPDAKILRIASPLRVRGVGTNKHETNAFVVIPVYFPGKRDGSEDEVLAYIYREFHIVNDLRA